MKKYIKYIITAIILISIIVISYVLPTGKIDKRLDKTLIKLGFVKEKDSTLYNKNNFHFNTALYTLLTEKVETEDTITKELVGIYDYKTKELEYTYRVEVEDSTLIIQGSLNNNKFICNMEYDYIMDLENGISDICDKVELDVREFEYEAYTLITDTTLLEYFESMKDKEI